MLACALLLTTALSATGQSVDAGLDGHVSDETGGSVADAVVTVSGTATGLVRSAITNAEGRYVLLLLPSGTYDISVAGSGFQPSMRRNQTLYVGSALTIDWVLAIAGIVEHLDVRQNSPLFETTSPALSRIVQVEEIDALPVLNRDFNDLAALSPGVSTTGVYGGVDISGSRDFQNAYLVDGVSAERHGLGNQRIAFAQDWIHEFQVLTSLFGAEFGQASGGVLNAVTRSGGNQSRARIYGFFRDGRWDAQPAFATAKPPFNEQRFGGTVGGPVVRNRVFYFVGAELFQNSTQSLVNSSFADANGPFPSANRRALWLAKVDAAAGRSQRFQARSNGERERAPGASIGGTGTQEHGQLATVRASDTLGSWTWSVSPTLLSEVRAAWSTSIEEASCNYAVEHPDRAWFERSYPGAQFGCPVSFGTIGERQWQLLQSVSWTRGAHTLKAGSQLFRTGSSGDFRNLRDGRYSFERDLPFTLDDPDSYPFSFSLIQGPTRWAVSGWSGGGFVQDSWSVSRTFTLSLGARYDRDGSLTALNPRVRIDKGLHRVDADRDNVAGRVGLAWTPDGHEQRTLVRGGIGVYYDQHHNNVTAGILLNNILVDRVVSINANNPLLNPFWPRVDIARAFLATALERHAIPDLSALTDVVGSTNAVDQQIQVPGATQLNGGVGHQVRPWLNASADVVYRRGFDLFVIRDVNVDPATLQRVNPNYSAIMSFGNGGVSTYRALQLQVDANASRARLRLAYTLARARSNTDSTLSGGVATNPFDYSEDAGPTASDIRHDVNLAGSTVLPAGLQLSGIMAYLSAAPYSVASTASRPDGRPFAFRPEPRNSRRGDTALSIDLRLAKTVTFAGHHSGSIFAEGFNLTNATNYSGYIGAAASSLFGQPTTAGPRRRLQLGLRYEF